MQRFDSEIFSKNMPFLADVAKRVGTVAETPYAWHGTSLNAIVHLATHGVMPNTGSYANDFYYAPTYMNSDTTTDHQRTYATTYARWNAEKQYARERLGFIPKDQERFMFVTIDWDKSEYWDAFVAEEIIPNGLTEEKAKGDIQKSRGTWPAALPRWRFAGD